MAMDYGYYVNAFGGSMISAEDFLGVSEEAEAILAALIYPREPDRLNSAEKCMFRRAVCYEAEYIFSGVRGTDGVKSERIGDYSVEYRAPSDKRAVSVNGGEVSPAAVSLLLSAGLMLRWV